MTACDWDDLVEEALSKLRSQKLIRYLRPLYLPLRPKISSADAESAVHNALEYTDYKVYDELQPSDRSSVDVTVSASTFEDWILDVPNSVCRDGETCSNVSMELPEFKLLLFSGNDYLGLSSHPTVVGSIVKAAQEHGMGPRGSALICGYTIYHMYLECRLADLKRKEDCLICPTGFAANMALMSAIGSLGHVLRARNKFSENEEIIIFSDALNHASIIDGILLGKIQLGVKVFVYKHCDMSDLEELLRSFKSKMKVVVTDSLFSMDGDLAPLTELAVLRKKYGFLLVIDDAHGTFVCGKNGRGVAEQFNCESDVDICLGTLSKAAGCCGGFIACSTNWKHLIQSKGRSYIFSTAIPVPVVAAAHAAIFVAQKESWRRRELWKRVLDFQEFTGKYVPSPIISIVVGSEEKALAASRFLLKSGFHVTAIRPPTVPPNSCRLRVTLSAAHRREDVKSLVMALSQCVDFDNISFSCPRKGSKL